MLPGKVEELKKEVRELRSSLVEANGALQTEKLKSASLEGYKEAFEKSSEDFRALRAHHVEAQEEIDALHDRQKELEREVVTLRSQAQVSQGNRDRIRAEAVKEYRLSQHCFKKKQLYAAGFAKYGFYLARSWLEKERPGQVFPELLFTDEVESFLPPPWTTYEPDSQDPEDYLEEFAQDDLANLVGPWSPRHPSDQPESIGALEGLDSEDLHSLDTPVVDVTSDPMTVEVTDTQDVGPTVEAREPEAITEAIEATNVSRVIDADASEVVAGDSAPISSLAPSAPPPNLEADPAAE